MDLPAELQGFQVSEQYENYWSLELDGGFRVQVMFLDDNGSVLAPEDGGRPVVTVELPHQCDEWVITDGDPDTAAEETKAFARGALEAHGWAIKVQEALGAVARP